MKTNFGRRRLDVRIILTTGFVFALALLWMIWPRCASQAPCSCPNQVVANVAATQPGMPLSQDEQDESPQFMSDITLSVVMNNRGPTSGASTTRVVTAGEKFLRRESPPRLDWGKREVVIKNRKDNWIINLFNRDALHYESVAQPTTVKVPVYFQGENVKGELLVGEEIKFFSENNAQKTIEGKEVLYELKIPDGKLKLAVDLATDKPLRIDVINEAVPVRSYSVTYGVFERRIPFDPQMFQVPRGVLVREWDLKVEKPGSYEGWKSEDPALLNYYLKPEPQVLLTAFEKLTNTGTPEVRQPLIELAAAILKREPTLITSFVRVAKQSNPEYQIWAALALRSCKTQDCLNVLKTNPFGFVEEGFSAFVQAGERSEVPGGRSVIRAQSVDQSLAEFIVSGDKESLAKVITFLDSRIEMSGSGDQAVAKPLSLDSAPPGIVDLIKKFASADPTVKAFLQSKQQAKSRSSAEILKMME